MTTYIDPFRYSTVNFFEDPHYIYPIAHRRLVVVVVVPGVGWGMGAFGEFKLRLVFLLRNLNKETEINRGFLSRKMCVNLRQNGFRVSLSLIYDAIHTKMYFVLHLLGIHNHDVTTLVHCRQVVIIDLGQHWLRQLLMTALTHYPNQCWDLISEVLWHSPENNFTTTVRTIILYNEF